MRPLYRSLSLATIAIMIVGCATGERPEFSPRGEGLIVLGDSLTDQSREQIQAELPLSTIDARAGRRMVAEPSGNNGLSRVAELDDGRRWIVALGTNDISAPETEIEQLAIDANTLLAAIDATAANGTQRVCVDWVLPHFAEPASVEMQQRSNDFGAAITTIIAERGCGQVLDWPDVATADDGLLGQDGIHFTEAGEQAFAELLAESTDA